MSTRRASSAKLEKTDRAAKSCPICGKPASLAVTPFCSKRCADIDLHRWLGEVYAVPSDEPELPGSSPETEH